MRAEEERRGGIVVDFPQPEESPPQRNPGLSLSSVHPKPSTHLEDSTLALRFCTTFRSAEYIVCRFIITLIFNYFKCFIVLLLSIHYLLNYGDYCKYSKKIEQRKNSTIMETVINTRSRILVLPIEMFENLQTL